MALNLKDYSIDFTIKSDCEETLTISRCPEYTGLNEQKEYPHYLAIDFRHNEFLLRVLLIQDAK